VSRPVDPHELRRAAGVATPSGFLAFPDLLPIASGRFHPVACRAVTLRFQERKGLVSGCCPEGSTQFRIIRPADAKGYDRLRTPLCIARSCEGRPIDIRHAADEVGISLLR
jgi:hypothetical protein